MNDSSPQPAEPVHQGLLTRIEDVPRHLLHRAVGQVKHTYAKLVDRYGPGYARAILYSGLAGLPIPVPFSTAVTAAPAVAAAEVHRYLARHGGLRATAGAAVTLSAAEVESLGKQLMHDLFHLFATHHAKQPGEFEALVHQRESALQRPLTEEEYRRLLEEYLADVDTH